MSHAQRDGYCLWIRSKSCVWADVKHRSVWTQAERGTVNTAIIERERTKTGTGLGPVSRKSRKLFGPEEPFVRLRSAYSVKLIFSYVVKGIKIKITAKFRASRRLRFEDTKRIMSPEMRPKTFGTFEKQAPDLHSMSPTALQYNLNNELYVTSQSGIDSCLFELFSGSKWQLSWFYSFADLWNVKVKCRVVWFINGVEIR